MPDSPFDITGRVAIIFEHDGGRYVREFYWRR